MKQDYTNHTMKYELTISLTYESTFFYLPGLFPSSLVILNKNKLS